MRLTKWIWFFILPLVHSNTSSQSAKRIQFEHFSAEHNLSEARYETILQDKKGYMWLGSENGLIKYDGNSITFFQMDMSDKQSLTTPNARRLCNDNNGNLWVAGDGGVSKYDPDSGYFTSPCYDEAGNYLLPSNYVSCLAADIQGKLWIGTDMGLSFMDPGKGKFTNISAIIAPDTLCNPYITCLMIDHNGLLWIGTKNGINIYDGVRNKIKLFKPENKNHGEEITEVNCLVEDHSGNVWIGLFNKGIYRYNPATRTSTIYRYSGTDKNSLSSDVVNSLMEDSRHTIWAGTFNGINIYQPQTNNFQRYQFEANNKYSLSSNLIRVIYEDRSGRIWIGTNRGGVNTSYPATNNFLVYQNWDSKDASHRPSSLSMDHTGKIYMTTTGAEVQEFNPLTGKFRLYKNALANDKLNAFDYYYNSHEASDGSIWLVGYDEGLHKFDRNNGKITTIFSDNNKKHNISNCIEEDLDKRLWIGTNNGLRCYDLKTRKYSRVEEIYPSCFSWLRVEGIAGLYCDREGILWVAGYGMLNLFNTKTGQTKNFEHNINKPSSMANDIINSFYDDRKGTIWIGTEGGLSKFDKKTEQFTSFTIKDGLPDNSVWGILPDENNNLWLGTSNGICRFTPPSAKKTKAICKNFDMRDGLPGYDFSGNKYLKGIDGTLYFGCTGGIVAFKPNELTDNPFIPPVVITNFNVLNKSVVPNDSTGILKIPTDETKEIKLSYKQNVIGFTFTVLNYIHPEKNKYAYKLEGFDKDWIYTDATKRFANYTNLDAAEYTFRVKGSNNDGIWNEDGVSIKLIITPPYWQTSWFKLLCVFAGGVILYAIWYSRMQKLRDIYRIRNKIAGDLHDDLGATLSSISIMSELANQQIKDQSPQASSLLEKIGNSSRNMIESVNDMVWVINPQNDSFENIIKRMRTFASEILSAKDIAFHFDFDKNLLQSKMKIEMRRNFYLIFKEAVNNVAKYSGASNTFVMILNRENKLKMTIRDDGNGFEMNMAKGGNGLHNMQQRADIMKARFNLESIPGKGTVIELEFKNE